MPLHRQLCFQKSRRDAVSPLKTLPSQGERDVSALERARLIPSRRTIAGKLL
jgi:hypothetical protein